MVKTALEAVTSWTGAAVEWALSVEAGNHGVGRAGFVWKFTFVDVSHAGWVSSRRLPAVVANALEFRLNKNKPAKIMYVMQDCSSFFLYAKPKKYLSSDNTVGIDASAMWTLVLTSIPAVVIAHGAQIPRPLGKAVAPDGNKWPVTTGMQRASFSLLCSKERV